MILEVNRPKLNMAIPSPASESMEMEFFTMIGIAMWNLQKPFQLIYDNAIGIIKILSDTAHSNAVAASSNTRIVD